MEQSRGMSHGQTVQYRNIWGGGNFLGRGCLKDCPGEHLDSYARLQVSKSGGDDLCHPS